MALDGEMAQIWVRKLSQRSLENEAMTSWVSHSIGLPLARHSDQGS